jgi:2-oxoisovalerate dehydrogenase E1 component subunit alpha
VFVCENNRYAISVPLAKQMAVKDVAVRAEGYGFEGVVVDGNDVLSSFEAMQAAVERARGGGGPTFIEAKTYRFHPHTSDDDDRTYRAREEVEEARKNDPILVFGRYLIEQQLLREEQVEEIKVELKAEVDAAVEEAWGAADPEPETAMRHVFAEPDQDEGGA